MAAKQIRLMGPVQVKRNTPEYKAVKSLIGDYLEETVTRRRKIKLYHVKPYERAEEAVLINDLKSNVELIYNLAYDTLHEYFYNTSKKLFREGNLYYFKSSAADPVIEAPFEFVGQLKKQLAPLQRKEPSSTL